MHQRSDGCGFEVLQIPGVLFLGLYTNRVSSSPKFLGGSLTWAKVLEFVLKVHLLYIR